MGVTAKVSFHFEPKRHDEVKDNGRTERQKRRIDEIEPDAAGGDVHFLAQPATNPEGLLLHKVSDLIHIYYT